ncbi:MAG: transmembrane permease MsmF [Chloroflexi bacterium RBG_13_50_21]|nr:MAG: transmembrane permease MsmF [Chloroflexi bacterium RBG_13_50_21]OGO62022.1 MAG: transmembrane permease MsmF [Chloroflexi bacterium RBG_19FT_COMBO_50_10]
MTAISTSHRLKRSFQRHTLPYMFIIVPMISMIVFLFIPMVVSLWWSLNDYTGLTAAKFVGLNNYIKLITDDKIFIRGLLNTTVFVLLGMSIGPTLGLLTALMLNQNVRFRSIFRTAYYLPVMTSLVVVSTIWVMLYNQNGLFNTILENLGLHKVGWLSNPHVALISVAIASIWQGFGFETVVFLAALQSIPRELYEAAMMDGAGAWAQFRFITLPSLKPVIIFVYIIGIIGSYQVFDQVFVMTDGGPVYSTTTIVYYLFNRFMNHKLGYASAIAYILFAILVIFSYMQMRLTREKA